jgi:hypothetical protein
MFHPAKRLRHLTMEASSTGRIGRRHHHPQVDMSPLPSTTICCSKNILDGSLDGTVLLDGSLDGCVILHSP